MDSYQTEQDNQKIISPIPTPEPTVDSYNSAIAEKPTNSTTIKKLHKIVIIISAVIIICLIAIIVIVAIIIQANNTPLFNVERIEQVCQKNELNEFDDTKKEDLSSGGVSFPSSEYYLRDSIEQGLNINEVAFCTFATDGMADGVTDITVLSLGEDRYYKDSSIHDKLISGVYILEDSNDYFKGIIIENPFNDDDYDYQYIAAFRNIITIINTMDYEAGEAALVELGYPNRSNLDPEIITTIYKSLDQQKTKHDIETLKQVKSALTKYQAENDGRLPILEEDGVTSNIEGLYTSNSYGPSQLDLFYRNYIGREKLVDSNGKTYSFIETVKTARPDLAKHSGILIHYGSLCEDGIVVESNDSSNFAVTLSHANGNDDKYSCMDNLE